MYIVYYTPILNFKLAPHHFYTLMYSVYYEYQFVLVGSERS